MWIVSKYNSTSAKDVCYNCDSQVAKHSYSYFRAAKYRSADKVMCKIWHDGELPVALYFAIKCRRHARLIEIAVRSEYKHRGIGRMVLFDLLSEIKQCGITKLTFRTPMNEPAKDFWLHMGATIMDVKGNDYEMGINIKD